MLALVVNNKGDDMKFFSTASIYVEYPNVLTAGFGADSAAVL